MDTAEKNRVFSSDHGRNNKYFQVTLEDFAQSFGTTVEDIPDNCRELIATADFRYKMPTDEERDEILLGVLKKIESERQAVGAPERQDVWEKGWAENLHDFVKSGHNLNSLVPKFIRPNQAIRFNRNYIVPCNPKFELDYFSIFRLWLFGKYLKTFDYIYEFGCGTGFNLAVLAQLYPKKKLYGLDFVPSSVDLVNRIGDTYSWSITGHLFNMRTPDENFEMAENSAIFTIGAIEQLAGDFEAFLQFVLKHSPKLCIHVEPTLELYDENHLVDYLAMKFHGKRGYTENYLTRLRELESDNIVEILKVQRPFFGSMYMEGYSCIIWRLGKQGCN